MAVCLVAFLLGLDRSSLGLAQRFLGLAEPDF